MKFYYIVNDKNELYCLELNNCSDWNEEKFLPLDEADNLQLFTSKKDAQHCVDFNMNRPQKEKENWHLCKILECNF